jgi:hypothetical protein
LRLFVAECRLRGIAELTGNEVEFVRARATGVASLRAPAPPAGPQEYAFDVLSPAAKGPVALVEVIHAVTAASPELSACVERDAHSKYERVAVELAVDATGDVFRARATGDGLPVDVARCLEAVLEQRSVSRPPGPATVTFDLKVRPARPAKQD